MNLKNRCFVLLVISFVVMIIPTGLHAENWDMNSLVGTLSKVEALITGSIYGLRDQHCLGVILSRRHVLTIYACTRGEYGTAEDLRVHVGFSKVYRKKPFTDGVEYEVDYVHDIQRYVERKNQPDDSFSSNHEWFFTVIEIKGEGIKFNPGVYFIRIPRISNWEYVLTGHDLVETVIFKEEIGSQDREIRMIQGRRDCDLRKIKGIPLWLIPSCLDYPIDPKDKQWWSPLGASLSYNNTVIGLKNHFYTEPPYPFKNVTSYSLFLNLAYYARYLERFGHYDYPGA